MIRTILRPICKRWQARRPDRTEARSSSTALVADVFRPKESIREIRINSNPFAAEYDRLGFGRIEIFTKPGTDKFRGQVSFNFGDRIFNSRNPFRDHTTALPVAAVRRKRQRAAREKGLLLH